MKHVLGVCFVAVLLAAEANAQNYVAIEFGAYGGIPLNRTLESAFCCTTSAAFVRVETDDASYIAGLTGGVVLGDRVHISFSALYMPVSFRQIGTTCCPISNPVFPTKGTSWEFPLVADYRWLSGSWRPFSGGGMVLHNRTTRGESQSPGLAVSGGVEWSAHRVVIRPEFRYLRYTESFGSNVLVARPPNQTQLLLGVLYRLR